MIAAGPLEPLPASANWLSKFTREAGETTGKGGARLGFGPLDDAARHLRALPPDTAGVALAAHVSPEGHWKFVNRAGEVYTAGTADELARVAAALAPDATPGGRLTLYLSEQAALESRGRFKDLPSDAALHAVVGKTSYPLTRKADGKSEQVYAEIRPNVAVRISDRAAVTEALFQLSRRLDASRVRVLALTPGGPDAFAAAPRFDPATKGALVDAIDPNTLSRAISTLRGQTAVISGRIESGQLYFRPPSGAERAVPFDEIERAAAASDVNLVVLQSAAPRQPGGRNWLWQKVELSGLDEALKRATLADFLNGLAAGRGPLVVDVAATDRGRTVLRALPTAVKTEPIAAPLTGPLADWLSDAVSNVTGNVVTSAVDVVANSAERQRELDSRVIPGIPSVWQFAYLAALIAGAMGLGVARGWWARIWPPEARADYAGPAGYHAARLAKFAAFALVFLPLAGLPAFAVAVSMQLWSLLTAPVRAFRWIAGFFKRRDRAAAG